MAVWTKRGVWRFMVELLLGWRCVSRQVYSERRANCAIGIYEQRIASGEIQEPIEWLPRQHRRGIRNMENWSRNVRSLWLQYDPNESIDRFIDSLEGED